MVLLDEGDIVKDAEVRDQRGVKGYETQAGAVISGEFAESRVQSLFVGKDA